MNSEFLPEAEEEFRESTMYYETKAPGVGVAFVAEVRRARDQHAARFGYDLDAIVRDFKEREGKDHCPVASLSPRRIPAQQSQNRKA